MKPIINKAFIASSGDIITDYNDLYCLFMCRVALCRVNMTICDRRNDKQALLYTAQYSRLNSHMKPYLQAVSQKHHTVLAKLELPHFIETVFVHRSIVGYSLQGSGNSPA